MSHDRTGHEMTENNLRMLVHMHSSQLHCVLASVLFLISSADEYFLISSADEYCRAITRHMSLQQPFSAFADGLS